MKNFVQNGKTLTVTGPTGGVVSGQAFKIGALALVAAVDIAEGATGAAHTEGVYSLTVTGADGSGNAAIAFGDKVYIDGDEINADADNGSAFGIALGGVASAAGTVIPVMIGRPLL